GQRYESADAIAQEAEGLLERSLLLDVAAFDGCGVLDAPVRGDGLPWPQRASFARGLITDREDEVHLGRTGFGELAPALRAQAVERVLVGGQRREGEWVDLALGQAPCGEGHEAVGSLLSEDRLSENGP